MLVHYLPILPISLFLVVKFLKSYNNPELHLFSRKNSQAKVGNYWPVNILNIYGKILDKIVYNHRNS